MGPEEDLGKLILKIEADKKNEHGESLRDLLNKHDILKQHADMYEWGKWEEEYGPESEQSSADPTIRRVNPGLRARKDL